MSFESRLQSQRALNRIALRSIIDRYGVVEAPNPEWIASGDVIGVQLQGETYFPAFQFGEFGEPLPIVARVISILRSHEVRDDGIIFWLTTRTGWLEDRMPVDVMIDDPDAVVAAANQTYDTEGF